MLSSKIIRKKKTINKTAKQVITDFIYSTFKFPRNSVNSGLIAVNEYENMRPDLVSDRIYGSHGSWDVLLKYNGISNPFSLKFGDILYAIPFSEIDATYIEPRIIQEREQKEEIGVDGIVTPGSGKDTNRIANLIKKKGKITPNLTKEGDKNVKIKDGKVIFGEDVTSINKDNCPTPISRSRLQKALLKDKLFL